MADRKARSVTFKLPYHLSAKELKDAIDEEIASNITVFQDLGNAEFLVELADQQDAELLITDMRFLDIEAVFCHPPHAKSTNVSILNLPSYINDDEVKEVLSQYGEIRGEVIRLKYKKDHAFVGLENGNRLVKMLLEKKSIPYSLRVCGEWCRIIHNDQQPVCSECSEIGHTRKRCPEVECRICKEKGHLSYDCDKRHNREQTDQDETSQAPENPTPTNDTPENSTSTNVTSQNSTPEKDTSVKVNGESSKNAVKEKPPANNLVDDETVEAMETDSRGQSTKRQLSTDSDSNCRTPNRRPRINPAPNLNSGKRAKQTARKS